MVMDVEIVSKEFIKPTSPTPYHLRTHRLSFLDQFIPSNIYVPMVFFYTNQETNINSKRSQLLKQSLSETLLLFYPLAGRIKDRFSIDCNDEGAYYVEARVNRPLNEFLSFPHDLSFISQLLPCQARWTATNAGGGYVAMIQVTSFACGSIVIGSFLSHMIVDGAAATTFLTSWATLTLKGKCGAAASPNFDASFVFPQSEAYPEDATLLGLFSPFLKTGICGSRRIVFDASAIASLKTKTASWSVPHPTRVEAVSALLCKCIMATSKGKSALINHAVNLRTRAVGEYKYWMGNFLCMAAALVTSGKEAELDDLVCHLRKAIRKADEDFVKSLQGEGGLLKFCQYLEEIGNKSSSSCSDGEIDFIVFSSWCNFGVYEIDFGWGKPTWVTCTASNNSETVFMNTIILMDTKMGDGIEAWVYLEEQDLVMLEQNSHLLSFGSLEHSPLK
ncbi:hypothetical protein PTKIN_Ptkin13bG0034900 [Pterospermum kingtungense]